VCHICRELTYRVPLDYLSITVYREDPWLLRAVHAEAGGCRAGLASPRRYPGSRWRRRRRPPDGRGWPAVAERPPSVVATMHRRALLAQGRAAARRPLLGVGGSAEAAGWWIGFRDIATDRLGGQR
jgi:hypothetical protein